MLMVLLIVAVVACLATGLGTGSMLLVYIALGLSLAGALGLGALLWRRTRTGERASGVADAPASGPTDAETAGTAPASSAPAENAEPASPEPGTDAGRTVAAAEPLTSADAIETAPAGARKDGPDPVVGTDSAEPAASAGKLAETTEPAAAEKPAESSTEPAAGEKPAEATEPAPTAGTRGEQPSETLVGTAPEGPAKTGKPAETEPAAAASEGATETATKPAPAASAQVKPAESKPVQRATGTNGSGSTTRATTLNGDRIVRVVPGRRRFHLDGCRLLEGKQPEEISLDEAREEGFTACTSCIPDRESLLAGR